MSFLTSHHGEYIHDYEKSCNLKLLAMLSQESAEDVLRESPFVDPKNIRWGSEYLFMNKGWYIVAHNAKEDTCDILYLADGSYYLWQASPASRLLQELNRYRRKPVTSIEQMRVR
mgnify:CR=1 FL=1